MASTFYQPNYVTDRRFSPSGFIPSGVPSPSIEEQNRMANAPAPVQGQQQGAAPAANPLGKLNQILGLNIGAPYQGREMRQATDALPAQVQVAGALGEQQDQQKAAMFAQRMQESGGMPVPGSPDFAQRSQAAQNMYNQIYGQQPTNPMGAFGQPSTTYAPTGLRDRAIAAGGREVQGVGGAMVSAGINKQGGNSFMLRQGAAPQSAFIPPSQPASAPVASQPAPSALQQAQGQYRESIAAMQRPRDNAPSGYRANPDGSLAFIPGGPADPAAQRPNLTQTQRNAEYAVEQGIKAGAITPEQKEEAVAVFSQELMGRAPKFPAPERDTAIGNAKYLQTLDALSELVRQSVDSGSDDFGPVANRAKRWSGAVFKGLGQKARQIEQSYLEAGSAKAFGEGGKQLTTTEKEMTFGQIGSPTDDDFPERLANHRSRAANVATLQLERLKASPYRFTSEGKSAIGQLEKALAGLTGGKESVQNNSKNETPQGVDPADWAAMTPEEQSLWK